jgi:hypothetical protein
MKEVRHVVNKVKYTVRYLIGGSGIANKGCFKILVKLTKNMQDILPAVSFQNKEHIIWMYAAYPIEDRWLHILTRETGIPLCPYPI